jgi:actin-related protein 4
MEIANPIGKDGNVEDWDVASKIWEYSVTSRLTSLKPGAASTHGLNDDNGDLDAKMEGMDDLERQLDENPLLMTETSWNTTKNRERAIELVMESWGSPAFWMARNSVLSAFAGGKASALVIDVGATTVSVVPVHDGIVLKKGIQKSNLAGNWLSGQIRSALGTAEPPVDLTPHFMIASKSQVDAGAPAQVQYKNFAQPPTASFRAFQEERVLTEFKESVVQVWSGGGALNSSGPPGTTNEDFIRSQPGRVFEMPDGSNRMWGIERYRVIEGMFDERGALPSTSDLKGPTIPELVKSSLANVDGDIRQHLLANVVVTGGTSMAFGFNDRLQQELLALWPSAKVKIQAAGLTTDRRFGSWIGGSIIASLGTFHQMWISKKEYDEHGAGIVEKRCK